MSRKEKGEKAQERPRIPCADYFDKEFCGMSERICSGCGEVFGLEDLPIMVTSCSKLLCANCISEWLADFIFEGAEGDIDKEAAIEIEDIATEAIAIEIAAELTKRVAVRLAEIFEIDAIREIAEEELQEELQALEAEGRE